MKHIINNLLRLIKSDINNQNKAIKKLKIYAAKKNPILRNFFSNQFYCDIAQKLPIFIGLYENCLIENCFYLPVPKKINKSIPFEIDVYVLSLDLLKQNSLNEVEIGKFLLGYGTIVVLEGSLESKFPKDWITGGNFGDSLETIVEPLSKNKLIRRIFGFWYWKNNNKKWGGSAKNLKQILMLNKKFDNLLIIYWSNYVNYYSRRIYFTNDDLNIKEGFPKIVETTLNYNYKILEKSLYNMDYINEKLNRNNEELLHKIYIKLFLYLKKNNLINK